MGLLSEKIERYVEVGQTIVVNLLWRGQLYRLQMFFPGAKFPTRQEVTKQVQGIYPNAVVQTVSPTTTDPTKPTIRVAKEGWSAKYKKSIDCDNPKGFSQRAHCQGRKKMAEEKDHEVSMAHSQLDKTIENAKKLKKKLGSKEKNLPAWVQAKITDTDHNMDAASSYTEEKKKNCGCGKDPCETYGKQEVKEEGLRDWFGKSKSKDGKKGWVNVVTGDSCASDKPGEGIPKCVSSTKRASMSKKERLASAAAKRREDPGQQKKSGAAAPTMVKTDRKTRKEEMEVNEAKDKPGKGSGKKDACYTKVKSRYSVWPSAYASGALVKCRKVGAANWGNSKKEDYTYEFNDEYYDTLFEKCWKGYEKKGMKTMFGKRYPNCVKKEEVETVERLDEEEYDKLKDKKLGGYTVKDRIKDDDEKEVEELDSIANRINAIRKSIQSRKKTTTTQMNNYEPEGDMVEQATYRQRSGTDMTVPSDVYQGRPDLRRSLELRGSQLSRRERGYFKSAGGYARMQQDNQTMQQVIDRGRKNQERLSSKQVNTANWTDEKGRKVYAGNPTMRFNVKNSFEPEGEQIDEFNIIQKAMDVVDNLNRQNSKKVKDINKTLRRNATSMPKHGYFTPKENTNESAAWTRKAGKSESGGLNEKGRKSYERENPGSDLKAPSKKKGNKRRASFCARMKGMKKKLTSAKTANDPDSRINKSLRAWNC
ncbi:hypothetical protein KNU05_gp010 [Synechococcus virus S-PRM1]|uniref:DUF6321 domain-containing protein n=1 Tax=Synechococcus virus S-PRM1 TaxID=2100130 RepID=A0A346FKN9_9CAUD|nr:hypothetical protein KNU05_gp010 [Synechococcus virus S-PRM1]AXN58544.1 hypothetical protein [Synechococcus virus S-PRM1]